MSGGNDNAALRRAAAGNAALCTIVGIDGSFSRRLGAQLSIGPDGECIGSLADGCLESELAARAKALDGPQTLRFGAGSPFVDFRLPCGSGLDILIDPSPDVGNLRAAVAALDAREEARLTLPSARLPARHYIPKLRLLVAGESLEAAELIALSEACGVLAEALRLGALGDPVTIEADRWTAIALLFHDHEWERAILPAALETPAFWIGAIGGTETRTRRTRILAELKFDRALIERVKSPIGLIPAARDAKTLAISVLAEIVGAYEALKTGFPDPKS